MRNAIVFSSGCCETYPIPFCTVKVLSRIFNGAPLSAAHRFRPMFDFGYVALDLLYAYPEDSGVYELVARNELGEVCYLTLS